MVSKRLFSAKTFQGKTPWKALSILFLLAVMILPSCSALTVSDSSDPTEIVVPKADTVSAIADFQPREIIELPPIADCFVVASYRQDLVTTHDDTQTLYLFDVHTQTSKALYTAAEGYYIKQTAANAEWIAWIETDYRLDSVGNMASAWKIMALNMLTGETKQVDQDANLSYSDNIPSFVGLAPKR
ncbi:MAG: hypothetical protein LBT22_05220, partial [Peptococcaceae bacterium]|nr:hypothetical protein [Peptococcaceae bacterium]